MTALSQGRPHPLGATPTPEGVNFAVWAPDAARLELCVFDAAGAMEELRADLPCCSHGVWHGLLPGAQAGLVYGLRAHGPWDPAHGHRFNPAKVLLDPYAREVVGRYGFDADGRAADLSLYQGHDGDDPGWPDERDNAAVALKARVAAAPRAPVAALAEPVAPECRVLYEVHVKGATRRHPGVPEALRGTYAGLAHPAFVAHLQALGVTSVSLLPVHARADEQRLQRLGLSNYWGYSSIGFFAPEPRYAADAAGVREEFRAMVQALHRAGIEVILDVVFNHTGETDEHGPTLSFRGLANRRYYVPEAGDASRYANWTGCGNCLNLAEPRAVELVLASLRHWLLEMGADGFRFDLAPVLGRGPQGFSACAAFFGALQADDRLARAVLIAEPWDLGPDGYQLGHFPPAWLEWNDRYRDALRGFWLHDGSGPQTTRGDFARRFAASGDIFHRDWRRPPASVNYVCAHDGFTLRDLVSYGERHNEANGEHNRDGHGLNLSWNCGAEGESGDAAVLALRARLQRALLGTLLLSPGTPMLLAGDEIGHSQGGNNNAYCQDNGVSWLDWSRADGDLQAFAAAALALRREVAALRSADWLEPLSLHALQQPREAAPPGRYLSAWLRADGRPMKPGDWQVEGQGALAIVLCHVRQQPGGGRHASLALLLFNPDAWEQPFQVPPPPQGCAWRLRLDSGQPRGAPAGGRPWGGGTVALAARSLQVAVAEDGP